MSSTERFHTEVLERYRVALSLWSEARAHYAPDQPEVTAVVEHLEAIERELTSFSQLALAA